MPTLMQKIRLAIRGWQRRREESDSEFVARNASWAVAPPAAPKPAPTGRRPVSVDHEGLTVAYLDDSGQLAHFLDTETGDLVDVRKADLAARTPLREPRYRLVPSRNGTTERQDRRAFVASLEPSAARDALAASADSDSFRRVLATNRTVERAWYNFRNDRAIEAIELWLEEM